MRMITLIIIILTNTWIILEIMYKLVLKLSCRLIQWSQQDLSHHQRTGNTMCHTKCWNQSSKRTEMVTTISSIITLQASMAILLVSTCKSMDKRLIKRNQNHMNIVTLTLTLLLNLTLMTSMMPRIKNNLRHRWHLRRIKLKLSKSRLLLAINHKQRRKSKLFHQNVLRIWVHSSQFKRMTFRRMKQPTKLSKKRSRSLSKSKSKLNNKSRNILDKIHQWMKPKIWPNSPIQLKQLR